MRLVLTFLSVLSMILAAQVSRAQSQPIRTTYVKLGSSSALLMEPATPGPKSHIAIVYTYPGTSLSLNLGPVNNFNDPTGPELAGRGYRELLLNHGLAGPKVGYESIAPAIGQAIKYARSLPGVDTVLLLGHSIGGPLVAFYENVAENGPGVCQGPEKIYPCAGDRLKDLPKADGVIFADVHLGEAFRHVDVCGSSGHGRGASTKEKSQPRHIPGSQWIRSPFHHGRDSTARAFLKRIPCGSGGAERQADFGGIWYRALISAIKEGKRQVHKDDEPFEVSEAKCPSPAIGRESHFTDARPAHLAQERRHKMRCRL